MDVFDALLRQAVSGLLAGNLTLSEEAAGRACAGCFRAAAAKNLRARARPVHRRRAGAGERARTLHTGADLLSRTGHVGKANPNIFSARPVSTDFLLPPRYTERTAYPMRAHFISRTARAVNPTTLPPTNSSGDFFIRSKGSQKSSQICVGGDAHIVPTEVRIRRRFSRFGNVFRRADRVVRPYRILENSPVMRRGDAHIAPAKRTVFSEIFGEFVTALGSMWASTPTNIPEGMQNFI